MVAQMHSSRTGYARGLQTLQITHLLLCPHLDHLARVALAVTVAKPVLSTDVTVTILISGTRQR
jgi:hypothetical protein